MGSSSSKGKTSPPPSSSPTSRMDRQTTPSTFGTQDNVNVANGDRHKPNSDYQSSARRGVEHYNGRGQPISDYQPSSSPVPSSNTDQGKPGSAFNPHPSGSENPNKIDREKVDSSFVGSNHTNHVNNKPHQEAPTSDFVSGRTGQ
ncbi:hypothetical protein GIB67_006114 [Kingdonia uniflora]|uniref:Uncharacterized protein n=1 Tax=Kingdonia uniflora TaxID=39325 RepID=A0A7J7LQ08_9MAGN|nr:hypothetical protein GIB67_006114 [Kingdonia uniflora]